MWRVQVTDGVSTEKRARFRNAGRLEESSEGLLREIDYASTEAPLVMNITPERFTVSVGHPLILHNAAKAATRRFLQSAKKAQGENLCIPRHLSIHRHKAELGLPMFVGGKIDGDARRRDLGQDGWIRPAVAFE